MQSLFYISGSSSGSLFFFPESISENNLLSQTQWTITNLVICGSLGEIIAFSGSNTIVSFPINNTNIYYNRYPLSYNPNPPVSPTASFTSASFPTYYYFYPNTILTSSKDSFVIYNNTKNLTSISQSIFSDSGFLSLIQGDSYTVTVSGSGTLYTSSISVIDISTNTIIASATASNNNISVTFSSSVSNTVNITGTTSTFPYLQLGWTSSADIPVSPTNSLSGWNSYLNINSSFISNSISATTHSVYLAGGNLSTISGSLSLTSAKLNYYSSSGLQYLTSLSLISNKLKVFPNISDHYYLTYFNISGSTLASPNINLGKEYIQYYNISYNNLNGVLPEFSSSINLQYFNCRNNSITGNIPSLTGCFNLVEFYCTENSLTGNIPSLSNCGNLTTFNCRGNNLTGYISGSVTPTLINFVASSNALVEASVDGILIDLANAGAYSGSVDLSGGTNAPPSAGVGADYVLILQGRGWEVYTN